MAIDAFGAIPQGRLLTDDAGSLDEAFERQLPGSSRLAFRVAYSVLRQREDAEDVAQEAIARAYRQRTALRDPGRLRAWLVRVCWRLALNQRRAALRRERRERAIVPVPRPDVEQVAAANESYERLWRAVDGLSEKLRLVVVLSGVEGHDLREIAVLTGLPEGTVKSRLHLARRRLAEILR